MPCLSKPCATLIRRSAATLLALCALPASAAVLTASDVTALPGSLPANNDFPLIRNAIEGYGPALGATGWSFGNLSIDQASNVTYEFLGFEARFDNQFRLGNDVVFSNFGSVDPGTSMGLWMRTDQTSDAAVRAENGLLDFAFLIDGDANNVVANGDATTDTSGVPTYVFKLFDGGQTAYILLDDNDPIDDNHDDMVIRVTVGGTTNEPGGGPGNGPQPVPVPGSLALAGAGLMALGLSRRRTGTK